MIYIGDRVRVKAWNQMEEEFGLEEIMIGDQHDSIIDCEGYFTKSMKELCGKEFEVTDIKTDNTFKFLHTSKPFPIERFYGLKEADEQDVIITEDMIEAI